MAWSLQFARYAILKYYRTQRLRNRLVFGDDVLDSLIDEAASASRSLDDRHEALRSCLKQLPERSRELLRLRYETDVTSLLGSGQRHRTIGGGCLQGDAPHPRIVIAVYRTQDSRGGSGMSGSFSPEGLSELIELAREGAETAEEHALLEQRLRDAPAACRYFVRYLGMCSELRALMGSGGDRHGPFQRRTDAPDDQTAGHPKTRSSAPRRWIWLISIAAAAVLAVFLVPAGESGPPDGPGGTAGGHAWRRHGCGMGGRQGSRSRVLICRQAQCDSGMGWRS